MNSNIASSALADNIVEAIRAVTGKDSVALHEPRFTGNEWTYLKDCLDSTYVSSVGAYVDRFESDLATYTGAKHAIAVVNGTAALHIALKLAGVSAGDEVLIPTLTFVATANAVAYCGATSHLVGSEKNTLGICAVGLREYLQSVAEVRAGHCVNRETGKVIRALVPMHAFGHPVDIEGLLAVAHDYHLAIVEDAAESLGSTFRGQHTGTFGLFGTLSFNGNKTITTGGGGAILTNDSALAKQAKHLTTTAKVPHRWEYQHDEIGYNYRLPNLNAALGCAQLEQLPICLDEKRRLYELYSRAFSEVPNVRLLAEPHHCRSNYWLQTLVLDESVANERDTVLDVTNEAGLMTRPAWQLMHTLAPFKQCPRMDLTSTEQLSSRLINIPSSAQIAAAEAG